MAKKDVAVFTDDILDLLSDYDTVELAPAEDTMEEADRLDRPGMLHKVALMYIQGQSYRIIGEKLGVRPAAVANVVNRQSFRSIIDEIGAEVVERSKAMLRIGSMEAVGVLLKTLKSDNEKNALAAANSVLNRIGLKSMDKVEIVTKVDKLGELSDDQLLEELLKEREARRRPKFVDVAFEGSEDIDVTTISGEADASDKEEGV